MSLLSSALYNYGVLYAKCPYHSVLDMQSVTGAGLPKHPLGVLKFAANGSACDETTAYIYDGVLGKMAMDFPPCSAVPASSLATGFAMSAHVNVRQVLDLDPGVIVL